MLRLLSYTAADKADRNPVDSMAQAGLTHQQNRNLLGPRGVGGGYIKGRCEETGDP